MRVLFLTQVLPYPLDAGPKVRAYYVLRRLVEAGHEVTLVSFTRDEDNGRSLAHLLSICREVQTVPIRRTAIREGFAILKSAVGRTPFLIARDEFSQMKKKIKSLISSNSFDVIHADQLWMAPYAVRYSAVTKTVLDQHNAVFQVPDRMAYAEANPLKRLLYGQEARKMQPYERKLCEQFDHVVWVSEDERRLFQNGTGNQRTGSQATVIPICVDPETQAALQRVRKPHRVTFMGGMHWPPNAQGIEWFAREIWPQISRQIPEAVLTVIGKNPPKILFEQGAIEATGYVVDPVDYLKETAVFIVPLLAGGGMRVKILHAWCWQLPVVSTRIGAEGLVTRNGTTIFLADSAADFEDGVVQVFRDSDRAESLAKQGRLEVENSYNWRKVYRDWEGVYQCVYSS